MIYLNNANEFRLWMIEVAFMTSEEELGLYNSAISYEEDILPELKRLEPTEYPCIVYIDGPSSIVPLSLQKIKFITKDQAKEMYHLLSATESN